MDNKMEKLARLTLPVTLVILSLAGVLIGMRSPARSNAGQKPAPAYMVAPIQTQNLQQLLELPAEATAIEMAWLSTTAEGSIGLCPFREGDLVKEGETLIEIDRELYRAEVELAEASLEIARAKLADLRAGFRPQEINKARATVGESQKSHEFMKKELLRIENLVKNGALADEELEKAQVKLAGEEAKLKNAQNQLEILASGMTNTAIAIQKAVVDEAEARVRHARARLSECRINAPFSGIVTRVMVRRGDMASPRQPLLELMNPASMVLRVAVPERFADFVKPEMKVSYSLDALANRSFQGSVARVFPTFDDKVRTRTVEIKPEGYAHLSPGMFARVAISLAKFDDCIALSEEVIQSDKSGAKFVFIVDENSMAKKRLLETGPTIKGQTVVVKGLSPGEKVLLAGFEKVKDGAEIKEKKEGNKDTGPGKGAGKKQAEKAEK